MIVKIKTDPYNARRYGRPWVANVALDGVGLRLKFNGAWHGQIKDNGGNGTGGTLVIEAESGDVIAHGQKDNRGGNTTVIYAVVEDNGAINPIDKAGVYDWLDARRHGSA